MEVLFLNKEYYLRTVSKFITGTDEDALLPIPVFYDPVSNKILEGSIPKDLREEYKESNHLMNSIFDWTKIINTSKPPIKSFTDKDWEVWNSYMVHRFLVYES